ncbi:MAG: lytic transglycosylase domain-containing protein [Verrucomicrobia bacterium]|nr:lytic transglycosylase domain-containing protein [Verrucomicrobiota bacterium]MCH8527969.1 lytic transglycosylase domain-containing protein [Kiritimatiellia bacterium]
MRTEHLLRIALFSLPLLIGTPVLRRAHQTDRALLTASREHRVDWRLLRAVAIQESRMNPRARGAAGEIGMFQIMPNTARHWAERTENPVPTEEELFNITLNARISAWYLRQGLDEFADREDPVPFALAYYNAGPSRIRAWAREVDTTEELLAFIPFPSTRAYVTRILQLYRNPQE